MMYTCYSVRDRKVDDGNECSELKLCDLVTVSETAQIMQIENYIYDIDST